MKEMRIQCPECEIVFVLNEENDFDDDNLISTSVDGHNTDHLHCGVCGIVASPEDFVFL